MKNYLRLSIQSSFIVLIAFFFTDCSKAPVDERLNNSNPSLDSNRPIGELSNISGLGIYQDEFSGEGYNEYPENPFIATNDEPISTFSIDADGGSYANVRRFLNSGNLPVDGAVRTEELINYFPFDYEEPTGQHPISLNGEIADCPWAAGHKLLRVGIQGKDIPTAQLPATNFVFLIDVSGSMSSENKLGLLKQSFSLFADHLQPNDKVAIVTYGSISGVELPSTSGANASLIKNVINDLHSGGGTAGAAGIITAYEIAEQNFIPGGNNRVILATDGDFNVGVSSEEALIELIEEKRESGVFLTVIGVGSGNYQDGKMEQLANHGNGTYEYLDSREQGEKVFIHEFKKFYAVAKDVKVQIHFNSNMVKKYRLIGYENRLLATEDFEDDEKDAGEIGANQSITALYEIIPQSISLESGATFTIDFRYKLPDSDFSIPIELDVFDWSISFQESSENMRFASAVAAYGMLLWGSEYSGNASYDEVIQWAQTSSNFDPHGYRQEFIQLVNIAKEL